MRANGSGFVAYEAAKSAAISGLRGTVLEIGAGRGRNVERLGPGVRWIGCEPDGRRRAELTARAARFGHPPPLTANAESLPLPDGSVDGVLSTVVLCSVRDQERVLAEVARVLRPGGILVFAEHVAAPPGTGKRLAQRLVAPASKAFDHGCDPVRDTERSLRRSALQIVELGRFELPVLFGLSVPYVTGTARRPLPV